VIQPNLWGVDARWYNPPAKSFFVVMQTGRQDGLTPESVRAFFGKPSRTETPYGYTVLIYNHDIAPQLANKPVIAP